MAELDLGKVVGPQGNPGPKGDPGAKGFSPTITESTGNTADVYKLTITNESGTFETPNLKGADGEWVGDSPVMGVKGSAEDTYRTGFVTISAENLGLSSVATSGSYDDLSDKPPIPAAVAVKGAAESSYRTGNVNLTAGNIGAYPGVTEISTNANLNSFVTPGFYWCIGGNAVGNKPPNVDSFGLQVNRTALTVREQVLTASLTGETFVRVCTNASSTSVWTEWRKLLFEGDAATMAEVNAAIQSAVLDSWEVSY